MTISIQSPFRSRERILAFGYEGTGKTSAILYVARMVLPTGAKFWIIDNDNTYDRLFETDFTDIADHPGLLFAGRDFGDDSHEWDGSAESIDQATDKMEVDDWLVVDLGSKLWNQVQEWYSETIFDESPDEYLLRLRQGKTRKKEGGTDVNLGMFEGLMDWPVINTQYHSKVSRKILRSRGHLFWVAEATKMDKQDDKQTVELYGRYGSRPAGQKGSRHSMQTVLAFGKKRDRTFTLESIKDRGRELWSGEGYSDFATDYLINTAKWKRVLVK